MAISQIDYALVTGSYVLNFTDSDTNYPSIISLPEASFARSFSGQTVTANVNDFYELSTGSVDNPLTLVAGGSTTNLAIQGGVLKGVGPLGYPDVDALGEGCIACKFATPQSSFGFKVLGVNGGNAYLEFFSSDGTSLGTITLSSLSIDDYYAFESTSANIAGFSMYNDDDGGLGIDEIKFDYSTTTTNTLTLSLNSILITDKEKATTTLNAYLLTEYDLQIYYVNKDSTNTCKSAKYITDIQDLDVNNWKHIKYVDMIGDYGDNAIKLSWTKTPDYSVWSSYQQKYQTDPSAVQATRWYNLGHARRLAFDIMWIGDTNIAHDAIEVYFNIKTE